MESDTFDAQPLTPLAKLRGPVFGVNGEKIWEQGTGLRAASENLSHFFSKADDCRFGPGRGSVFQHTSLVANRAVAPIHIFDQQVCNVRLAASQMPAEFVEVAALRVALTGDNLLVFIPGDCLLFR